MKHFFLSCISLCAFCTFSSQAQEGYPKIAGYIGLIHPIVSTSAEGTNYNFSNSYVVGMPTGINILKSDHIGFSIECVPFIRSEGSVAKMNNFLFHPGVMFRLKHGVTIVTRAAFETSGRFGFTPVLNKVVKKNKASNYFVAIPLPLRFGNDHAASWGIGFQFGVGF